MAKIYLKLFVAGDSGGAREVINALSRICEGQPEDGCDLKVIDVLAEPQLAEDDRILATPTLVKAAPPPERRIVGDLSDPERVGSILGLEWPAAPNDRGDA